MEEKDKTYTLEEVTYFYLVDKVHDTNYKRRKVLMRALEALDPKERIDVCEMLLDIDEK